MDFRILGPLEVHGDGGALPLGAAKPRAVLAVLVLHANQPVSVERLATALWGDDAPTDATRTVQVYVSRLRKALGDPEVIATTPAGYRLRVGPSELDVERFERGVEAGRRALGAGLHERAAALLSEALEMWRGPPLADLEFEAFAQAEIVRLQEERLAALEARIEADLGAGRHAALVSELRQLLPEHPGRERLAADLMLALYRSGRQAEALEVYREAHRVLVDQVGIEPGPELRRLHEALLRQDASLDVPAPASGSLGNLDAEAREVWVGREVSVAGARRRSALPASPNRTIGRGREVGWVAERLRAESVRLVTLIGPGGVGKTRLALEAARAVALDFADGAHFVSLAAVARSRDVPTAIVNSLGIIPLAGESAEQAVERFLAAKHLLLVVDSCEHLPGAAPFVGALAVVCPGVSVLATSREPLAVRAEHCYPVSPLALPERGTDRETVLCADAVALFCERARAHDPGFDIGEGSIDAIAAICRHVDGLPLAIELAAARCALLSPEEIATRLHGALDGLGAGPRDAPARQQTLRATIDWSHSLLSEGERACFARFAVFAGGAPLEAAQTITGAAIDTLEQLVGKSLLVRRRQADGSSRLGMLETVRAYAGERLAAAPDCESVRERHFGYCLSMAQRHGTDPALFGPRRQDHFACLDGEVENLRAALEWASKRDATGDALALSAALLEFWHHSGRLADAVLWVEDALLKPSAASFPAQRAHALCKLSWPLWAVGRGAEAPTVLSQAETIARTLGDPVILSAVLYNRAAFLTCQGRLDVASGLADEALSCATASGDPWTIAMAAWARALVAGSADELRERVERAASLLERAGNVWHLADVFQAAGRSSLRGGRDDEAIGYLQRASPLVRGLAEPFPWMLLRGKAGLAALFTGDLQAAQDAFREELKLCRELVVMPVASEGLAGLAAVAAAHNELDRAGRLSGAAGAHRFGEPEHSVDARLHATFLEPARARRGADPWDAAVRQGAALSLKGAIAYALDEPHRHAESPAPNPPAAASHDQ